MTIQNLFVADLSDILRLQLECTCGAQLSYNPDKSVELPYNCPQCRGPWKDRNMPGMDARIIEQVLEALKQAREQQRQGDGKIKIKLVFAHQDNSEGTVP